MNKVKAEKAKAEMQEAFEQVWEELYSWREAHPEASFDEIAAQVTPRRRALIGQLLAQLACQHGAGEAVEGVKCPRCGEMMKYKGRGSREVEHLEGETELERAYYHCAGCESGLFPPG
jgi:ferric-dicitrate binding protein FerR (iron transport regulator)